MCDERAVGEVWNYYGGISVKQEGGAYFWAIDDWDGLTWREIPKYLFDALNRHQDELDGEAEEEK
jgi:hypothetical protein